MIIRYKDFRLEQQSIKGFDLYREVKAQRIGEGTLQAPTGEEYLRSDLIGYNMSLEKCIEDIIHVTQSDDDTEVLFAMTTP